MSEFYTKPRKVEATQWFKDGDHDAVQAAFGGDWFFIMTPKGRYEVHPGDWIITKPDGEIYLCAPDLFARRYLPAPPAGGAALRYLMTTLEVKISGVADDEELFLVTGSMVVPIRAGRVRAAIAEMRVAEVHP